MRILIGKYKGKKLNCTSNQSIRPTTNRIKEYIFSILSDFCEEKNVADIFSGTGNLGIEALSRNASHVDFIENSPASIEVLKQNLDNLKIDKEQFQIIRNDAIRFSKQSNYNYDLILMDPPFVYPPLNELLDNLFRNQFINPDGLLVVEHEITNTINANTELFEIFKQKKIGRSLISFLINNRSHGGK